VTLNRFVVDVFGVVHELYPYEFMGLMPSWSWPTGHVDAQSRRIVASMSHGAATCLACIRDREKMPEHVRLNMERLLDKFMR
jgi:hypothetical protein